LTAPSLLSGRLANETLARFGQHQDA
jgi:hypothetical protein